MGSRLGGHRMLVERKNQIHSLPHSQFLKTLPVLQFLILNPKF